MKFINSINDITLVHSVIEGVEDNSCFSYMLNENYGFISVYDGAEKIGDKKYFQIEGHSEAYLAPRVVADTTVKWFKKSGFTFSRYDAEYIGSEYYKALRDTKLKIDTESSAVVGSKRSFPASATVIGFDCTNEEFAKLEFLYTGNTRGYIIDEAGLCQITKEDSSTGKTYENAAPTPQNDIQNILSADGEEAVNYRAIKVKYPAMIIAATDGAFANIQNPMILEKIILSAISECENLKEFEKRLQFALNKDADDDYTVMTVIFGFSNLEDIKNYYARRLKVLNEKYCEPYLKGDITKWEQYKMSYYR